MLNFGNAYWRFVLHTFLCIIKLKWKKMFRPAWCNFVFIHFIHFIGCAARMVKARDRERAK